MAMSLQEQLRAKRAETERWMREREAQVRSAAARAEAKGRQVYADTIKTGQKVLARTPSEIRALGTAALQGRLPQAVGEMAAKEVGRRLTSVPTKPSVARIRAPAKPAPRPESPDTGLKRELQAGLSGVVDEVSFGLADRALAASEAVGAAVRDGDLSGFGSDYETNMASKRAADDFDAQNHALARNTGRLVGLGLGIAATGPVGGGVKALMKATPTGAKILSRLARAPRLKGVDPRGMVRLAVGGGASAGVVGQVAGDAIGGRRSEAGDLAAAALGGGVAGLATLRSGAMRGGLVGGALTSAARDVLDGRIPSVENAIEAGHAGAITGGLTEGLGVSVASILPNKIKGELGETMSALKTLARGRIPMRNAEAQLKNGRYAVPDQTIDRKFLLRGKLDEPEYLESKLGPSARLTGPQIQLRSESPGRFAVDAWQFGDAGKMFGAGGAQVGPLMTDEQRFPWRLR
jgi:hypothetical protein